MIANALKKSSGINYPGLIAAWSAKGKTNDDEDRAILKDLTGNGHDITLNGFAFSEMSGYGGYKNKLTNLRRNTQTEDRIFTITSTKITVNAWDGKSNIVYYFAADSNKKLSACKFKLSNITGITSVSFNYLSNGFEINDTVTEDGIYELKDANYESDTFNLRINTSFKDKNVIIKLLPEYPDALVFDGVDDYGQSIDRIKALTKYTIILKRKIIKATNGGCVLYKGDLHYDDSTENFGVEFTDNKYWYYYSGLLGNNKIIPYQEDIIYAKEKSYNGQQMNSNLDNVADNPIVISTVNKTGFVNMAFYSAYLFDRSLDEQEIKEFIRKYIDPEYLLPSEIPTPDCYYDFSLGSNDDENRETIKDQSGNGNDAKAYNIAWNEEGSGYKDGALYLDGVNDYIALEAFNSGFKTMFMVCNPFINSVILYDQRKNGADFKFAIYNGEGSKLAYKQRNDGETYINGVLNTTIRTSNLINKKHLITIKNNSISLSQKPIIGSNYNNTQYFANMAIYKFLGFKEELTEEQIQAIIKKYNLLDGVDEIEVS